MGLSSRDTPRDLASTTNEARSLGVPRDDRASVFCPYPDGALHPLSVMQGFPDHYDKLLCDASPLYYSHGITPMNPLRIALIGCGNHSEHSHAIPLARYALQHPDELQLGGACD